MLPFHNGKWVTIDRSVVDLAHMITSSFGEMTRDEVINAPSVESEHNVTPKIPVSDIDSVHILSLPPLLKAIKADHPKWNGFSEDLARIFLEKNIDPRIKYNKFYSTRQSDIVASYTWAGRSLFSIAGLILLKKLNFTSNWPDLFVTESCMDLMKNSKEFRIREKTIWIDVLLLSQQQLFGLLSTDSNLVVKTLQRFECARDHILFVDQNFFKRAWCLFEIAISSSSGSNILVCSPHTSINRKILLNPITQPYEDMQATHKIDLLNIRQKIKEHFGSSENFNAVIQKLYCYVKSTLYYEIADQFRIGKPQPGKGAGLARNSKNEFRALELYRTAASLGHPEAEYWLGNFYDYGRGGLEKNEEVAVQLYKSAADKGCAAALAVLGRRYECGRGVAPPSEDDVKLEKADLARLQEANLKKAAEMYRLAADKGHAAAQFDLAELYEAGRAGLPKDLARARALYQAAAEQGYAKAVAKVRDLPALPDPKRTFIQRIGMTFVSRR